MSHTPEEATEVLNILKEGRENVLSYVENKVFYTNDVDVQLKAVAELPEAIFMEVQEDLHMMGFEKVQPGCVYDLDNAKLYISENGVFYAE